MGKEEVKIYREQKDASEKCGVKRQYKKLKSNPVRTGLAKRSPTFTLKDGFQDRKE